MPPAPLLVSLPGLQSIPGANLVWPSPEVPPPFLPPPPRWLCTSAQELCGTQPSSTTTPSMCRSTRTSPPRSAVSRMSWFTAFWPVRWVRGQPGGAMPAMPRVGAWRLETTCHPWGGLAGWGGHLEPQGSLCPEPLPMSTCSGSQGPDRGHTPFLALLSPAQAGLTPPGPVALCRCSPHLDWCTEGALPSTPDHALSRLPGASRRGARLPAEAGRPLQ